MLIIAYYGAVGSLKFGIYELTSHEDKEAARSASSKCSELPFEEAMMKYCEERGIKPIRSGMNRLEAVTAKRAIQKTRK